MSRARPKSTRLPSILSDLTNGEMPFDSFSWDNLVARNDCEWCGRFRLELLFPNLGSKSSFWGKDDREPRPNSACEYCQDTSPGRVPVGHSSTFTTNISRVNFLKTLPQTLIALTPESSDSDVILCRLSADSADSDSDHPQTQKKLVHIWRGWFRKNLS